MRISKNSLAGFLCEGVVYLAACISMDSNDVEKVIEDYPAVSSMTPSPDVPSSVPLCRKLTDITRCGMWEAYDRELSSSAYLHSTTMLLIKRASCYLLVIEPTLKTNGISDDFKYLAMIESHLDPRVSSPARTTGAWQLLEGTVREYGLTITPAADGRCHVEKTTRVACRYLRAVCKKYGDWAVVAASYNDGMGRVSGEPVKQGTGSSFDLWLVEGTARYTYRITAIEQVFENPSKHGFVLCARNLYKPIPTVDVVVSQNIQSLPAFAREHGITCADLKYFNPWLRDRKLVTGGKTYRLSTPQEKNIYYKTPNTEVYGPAWVVSEN